MQFLQMESILISLNGWNRPFSWIYLLGIYEGGIRPSPWKELELHENSESYDNKILGMWIEFSCYVFQEKSLKDHACFASNRDFEWRSNT